MRGREAYIGRILPGGCAICADCLRDYGYPEGMPGSVPVYTRADGPGLKCTSCGDCFAGPMTGVDPSRFKGEDP